MILVIMLDKGHFRVIKKDTYYVTDSKLYKQSGYDINIIEDVIYYYWKVVFGFNEEELDIAIDEMMDHDHAVSCFNTQGEFVSTEASYVGNTG